MPSLTTILKISVAAAILIAVGTLFYFADTYVESKSKQAGPLELVNMPQWVSPELEAKIRTAAGGENFELNENVAKEVADKLASVAWLTDVKIQTIENCLRVNPEFRKPVALVKSGLRKFYVDKELVVLDFVPISSLPIIRIIGLPGLVRMPKPGESFSGSDIAAAVEILSRLNRRDRLITKDRPLLYEIESIDVSNYNGRQNSKFPHIVLYTTDKTEIIWGAEIDKWQRYLESTDEQKLAKLYDYYKKNGSLLNGAKYINLRDPQDNIPQPIDKY